MCTYFFAIKFVYSFNAILLTYVPKGVFTKRRYPRLWLTSKLDAHFAGMRTLAPFGAVFDIGFLSAIKEKKALRREPAIEQVPFKLC